MKARFGMHLQQNARWFIRAERVLILNYAWWWLDILAEERIEAGSQPT